MNITSTDDRIHSIDRNETISALLASGGWGLLAAVVFVIIVSLINNPTIIPEAIKFIDRFAKYKRDIVCGNFKILKLTRTYPEKLILVSKIILTIVDIIILGFVLLLSYLILVSPLSQVISLQYQLLVAFLFMLPTFSLIDMYAPPVCSSVTWELDESIDNLFYFCLKRLFDMGAIINRLDAKSWEIEARLQGNQISIKFKTLENSRNQFVLSSKARFFGNSPKYRRNINSLIYSLCY